MKKAYSFSISYSYASRIIPNTLHISLIIHILSPCKARIERSLKLVVCYSSEMKLNEYLYLPISDSFLKSSLGFRKRLEGSAWSSNSWNIVSIPRILSKLNKFSSEISWLNRETLSCWSHFGEVGCELPLSESVAVVAEDSKELLPLECFPFFLLIGCLISSIGLVYLCSSFSVKWALCLWI